MTTPVSSKARIQRYFKKYFVRFTYGTKSPEIPIDRAMDCLTLALAQNELDEMEAALTGKAQLPTSKIDISRDPHFTELNIKYLKAVKTLTEIAEYNEGKEVDGTFDEPASAALASRCLKELGAAPK